ncbi:hypothetical protein KUTeg_017178 [Tegillarca granosa]|uniref:Uncharacterized protein n=1 Tax=Tegillarca granosa TaxID=220873 RepID=A0ABQ9EN05_TEGGR|nr:hypothetical protein KUTeg_017178 [Tegillarca granosa]
MQALVGLNTWTNCSRRTAVAEILLECFEGKLFVSCSSSNHWFLDGTIWVNTKTGYLQSFIYYDMEVIELPDSINFKNDLICIAHRRKSAVELLEASKSEYVKRSHSGRKRQTPFCDCLHYCKFCLIWGIDETSIHINSDNTQHMSIWSLSWIDRKNLVKSFIHIPKSGGVSGSQIKQSKSDYVISHHLNTAKSAEKETTDNSIKSINSYSSSLIESGTSTPDRKNGPVLFDIDGSSADSAKIHKSSDLEKSSNIVSSTSIRRKSPISGSSDKYINKSCVSSADMDQNSKGDGKAKVDGKLLEVTSADVEKSSKSQDCLLPNTYQSLSSSVNVLVEKRCSSPFKS